MAAKKHGSDADLHVVELDGDALGRLEEFRREHESFSDVIKRCIPMRHSAADILRIMQRARLSPSTLEAIDRSARQRRETKHRTKE